MFVCLFAMSFLAKPLKKAKKHKLALRMQEKDGYTQSTPNDGLTKCCAPPKEKV